MKIHPQFADWYRKAGINPDQDTLEKRMAGISDIAKDIDRELIAYIARVFCHGQVSNTGSTTESQRFRTAFQNHDATYGEHQNEQEGRILAGAFLGVALTDFSLSISGDVCSRDLLALMCKCMTRQGVQINAPVPAIFNEVDSYIERRARMLRARKKYPPVRVPKFDITEQATLLQQTPANQVATPLAEIAEIFTARSSEFLRSLSKAQKSLENRIESQDEELNILWWVVGGFSRFDNSPLVGKPLYDAVLICGRNLADLTRLPIGPLSVPAFIDNVLRNLAENYRDTEIRLDNLIAEIGDDTRDQLNAQMDDSVKAIVETLNDVVPISYGIIRSSVSPKSWQEDFGSACNIDEQEESDSLALALQYYTECMLLRSYATWTDESE